MNEFKTCDKCFNSSELVKGLKEIDASANIEIGCQSMCAVGSRMPFVIVNGIPVIGEDTSIVLEKVKAVINNNGMENR